MLLNQGTPRDTRPALKNNYYQATSETKPLPQTYSMSTRLSKDCLSTDPSQTHVPSHTVPLIPFSCVPCNLTAPHHRTQFCPRCLYPLLRLETSLNIH